MVAPAPVDTGAPRPGARTPLVATLALVLAAFLFGSTFLVVQDAVRKVDVLPFLAARFVVGAAVLLPLVRRRTAPAGVLRAGTVAGGALAAGYLLQTYGLRHTTTSVSAFLTYLLVVFVPLIAAVWLKRPPTGPTVAGVVLACAGLVLLTGGAVGMGWGELLTIGCAWAFALHIVVLARVAPRLDTAWLNIVQLAVVAALIVAAGVLAAGGTFVASFAAFPGEVWFAALYTGVVVTAGAFMLQVWAQRVVGPTRTALVLILEPVFAAVLGYMAGERLGVGGALGAGLILAGILLSETSARWRRPHRVLQP